MTIYTGTSGNDNFVGTSAADIFDMSQGGRDSVAGAGNNDRFLFGGTLTHKDTIFGDDGYDSVELDGDYSGGLKFDPFMVWKVEVFRFAAGHSYDITFDDTNFESNDSSVDGSGLLAGDSLIADLTAETDADMVIIGGAGDDILKGGQQNNSFQLEHGGADDVTGNVTADSFFFGGAFDVLDVVDGKDGDDTIQLSGDYSAGLTLFAPMTKHVEQIWLTGAFDYVLTGDQDLLGNNDAVLVNGSGVAPGNHVEYDMSAVKKGSLELGGSPGDDTITGSNNADTFTDSLGGADVQNGQKGDDTFNLFGSFDALDEIDGGKGYDILNLHGDYSAGVVFQTHTIRHVEEITLDVSGEYNLTLDDGNLAAGDTLIVGNNALFDPFIFNGVAELDGQFDLTGGVGGDTFTGGELNDVMYGGSGNDRLNGYHGDDTLYGGANADTFNGGLGLDVYVVGVSTNSNGTQYDRTLSFDTEDDVFDIEVAVTGIDPTVNTGALSTATFVNDIQAAVDNPELAAHHAVIFHPDSGDLAGKRFLVIDANGIAGCEAFQDYIIELTHFKHLSALDVGNFI